jgi:prevent-host-death family protein
MTVTIHEAKTHLSRLIRQVMDGEEVIIAKGSIPMVVLQRAPRKGIRIPGRNRGKIFMAEDFNDPIPDFTEYQ